MSRLTTVLKGLVLRPFDDTAIAELCMLKEGETFFVVNMDAETGQRGLWPYLSPEHCASFRFSLRNEKEPEQSIVCITRHSGIELNDRLDHLRRNFVWAHFTEDLKREFFFCASQALNPFVSTLGPEQEDMDRY